MLRRLLKIHDFSFCLAVTFKVQHGFCSTSWFKKTQHHCNSLGNRCPSWSSHCICPRDRIRQTHSPGPGGWELLSSNWNRRSSQLLLSKGIAIWGRAACLEIPQQCDIACGEFSSCYCSKPSGPQVSGPPPLPSSYSTEQCCLGTPGQTVVSSPTVLHKTNQYSHLGSSMYCIPGKKPILQSLL